jgi:uncharacterized protein
MQIAEHVCDGRLLKMLFASGFAWLEHHQQQVNQMNVFPVPDGDTGTNMRLTLQKAHDAIAHMESHHAGEVAQAFARGALLGARGNSGVILSQLLKGFADGVKADEVIDTVLFAQGCQQAATTAYDAVIDPVEGTILTVAREAADALSAYAADHDDLCAALDVLIDAAKAALQRTPELLPTLKKAGVLDSGGQGLVFILEGMSRTVNGLPVMLSEREAVGDIWQDALTPDDDDGYGYDVQFLMHGQDMDVQMIRAELDAMGWSTLVVGDEALIKVHIHVHDPGQPLSYAVQRCDALDDVVVENMQRQYEAISDGQRPAMTIQRVEGVAVIAVASGDAMQKVFYDAQAAHVISGGQSMNPSTDDFLQAINALENDAVILLPNNKNILMAARQAAHESDKRVRVVPTTTVPQGVSAMLPYLDMHADGDVDAIAEAMDAMRNSITTAEVTHATRNTEVNGVTVREGQAIGILDGALIVAEDAVIAAVIALLSQADMAAYELVTLYSGADVSPAEAEALRETLQNIYPDHHIEIIPGEQPIYPYLISLE